MAQFVLPKNSRPQKTGKVHKADGAAAVIDTWQLLAKTQR